MTKIVENEEIHAMIHHLAHRADWDAAQESGEYRWSSRDLTLDEQGFIHASRPDQLAAVAEFVYHDDEAELCVLVIDEDAVIASGTPLREEDGGDGELYPHIYGPVLTKWVTEVIPAHVDDEGIFHLDRDDDA